MEENTSQTPPVNPVSIGHRNRPGWKLIAVVLMILISTLFGAIGGAAGVLYAGRIHTILPFFPLATNPVTVNETVNLDEDSAVIDVVKKGSPAVVSIIISKDINKLSGYGQFSPFEIDPFAPFFGFTPQQQPRSGSATPNIQEVGAGTGFFVSSDGLILTNKHVVADESATYSVITSDDKTYDAKVLARDPVNDFAIVKIEISNAPTLQLTDSSQIQIGQRVVAIGNSLGQYHNTVTTGVVSGIGRSIVVGDSGTTEQLDGVIQTDAAINPGNSGGPLLNILGQVIGINTAVDRDGQLVGFAIPSSDIQRSLDTYNKNGKITRPYLGVRYITLNKAIAAEEKLPKDYGALIVRGDARTDFAVLPGSPADKAGLVENDIILEVDGVKITQDMSLSRILKTHNVGDVLRLKVYDKGTEKEVTVTLEEMK
jgi:serine protease Do